VVGAVAQWIPSADGITVSGGEPFDQPIALMELLGKLRSLTEADVLVFTGHPWTKVRETVDSSPGLIDALVTGHSMSTKVKLWLFAEVTTRNFTSQPQRAGPAFASFSTPITKAERTLDVMFR